MQFSKELTMHEMRLRIDELETICGEAYQVVGILADKAGVFETSTAVEKILDNLSEARLVHDDVLPFVLEGDL
ncbi:hypothetical protein E0G74_01405 [Salmonella enterica]|nr:hypothetical protein [Salmonella enterica]ECB1886199.1 hypothetical protein [Salmonella enterica subsp. enterica serovar Mississippi]EGD6457194.1 hypothetical protein [Salmonella enterica]